MDKYVIRNEEDGMMLATIGIKRVSNQQINSYMVQDQAWTHITAEALLFEVCEEAEATINFISDVIDWELAQQLTAELVQI